MGFVVTENIAKKFDPTNKKMRTDIKETIDEIKVEDINRDGKRSTKGTYRVDITAASNNQMLVQMQSGGLTFATALYSLDLVGTIEENFLAFQEALKEALDVCQTKGKNTIITWE